MTLEYHKYTFKWTVAHSVTKIPFDYIMIRNIRNKIWKTARNNKLHVHSTQ